MGKILRIGVHGIVLAVGCLASILVGFGFYLLLNSTREVNQLLIQVVAAVFVLIVGFTAWYLVFSRISQRRGQLVGWGEFTAAYIISLVFTPLIFLPLHYLTQGYISSLDNLLSILYFQIPTNFITLLIATYLIGRPDWLAA